MVHLNYTSLCLWLCTTLRLQALLTKSLLYPVLLPVSKSGRCPQLHNRAGYRLAQEPNLRHEPRAPALSLRPPDCTRRRLILRFNLEPSFQWRTQELRRNHPNQQRRRFQLHLRHNCPPRRLLQDPRPRRRQLHSFLAGDYMNLQSHLGRSREPGGCFGG
jgi:hypothetical protein